MRIAISSFAALLITLALFFIMQSMIKGSGQTIDKPRNYGVVDFVRLQRESPETSNESMPRLPTRHSAPPPRTLPALSPNLPANAPPAAPQPELPADPLTTLTMAKPFLAPAIEVVPKSTPLRSSPDINKIAIPAKPELTSASPAPSSALTKNSPKPTATLQGPHDNKTSAINVPALPPGTIPDGAEEQSNNGTEAIPVFKIQPSYPRKAARSRIEGWVKLEFTITENGTVSDPVVVDSKPRRTFDRSAIQSIRQWRFKPRIVGGKPVKRKASQVIEFRLSKG